MKLYDIWVHYGYADWSPKRNVDVLERGKIMEDCHKYKQSYIVYDSSGLIVEQLFVENER